jgi:Rieske Fe-S protein
MSDHGFTRRAALGAAGVVAVGAVAGYAAGRNTDAAKAAAAADAGDDGYGTPPRGGAPRRLAAVADVPDGGGLIVGKVVITRSGSQVRAFSAVCTHQGCRVNKVSDGRIDCPCHGSVFDAATGAVVTGPASTALPRVAITVRDGEVFGP